MDKMDFVFVVFLLLILVVVSFVGWVIGYDACKETMDEHLRQAGVVLVETKVGDKVEYSVKNISEIKDGK